MEFDSLGLKLHLPTGSNVVAEKVEGRLVVVVSDDPEAPTWTLRIQNVVGVDPKPHTKRPKPPAEPTAASQSDDLLFEMQDTRQNPKVLIHDPVTYAGITGHQLTVERKNDQNQAYVSSWVVLPTGPRLFLVFALQTLPDQWAKLQTVLHASYSTIELKNAQELASEKSQRLEAGRAFIDSLTPDKIRPLVGQKQWHRVYRPADGKANSTDTEAGYYLVEVLEAKRGAINPERPENKYTAIEKKDGLMVRVQAKLFIDVQRKDFYDSSATYWMAWDQSEETWSNVGTHRQGDAEKSESETGVRESDANSKGSPRLVVMQRAENTDPVPYQWNVPDVYLSQALGWLAGRLLPRDDDQPRKLAYYFFVSNNLTPKIYLRLDEWAPSSDGSGGWTLSSQFTSDTAPSLSTYGRDGSLIRRSHPDGSITEPIALDELRRIYKSKGLNVGSTTK